MKRIDRYIYLRLAVLTFMIMLVLIFVFIIIDFSENSDSFTDRGATFNEIWGRYYKNYIPEMVRLVSPLAVFVATLLIVGQMTERLELTALKGAGVSLYRFMVPFMVFALLTAIGISYLDGYVVPKTNAERIAFEREYISRSTDRVERSRIYRQESPGTLMRVHYYDPNENIGYQVHMFRFEDNRLVETIEAARMDWQPDTAQWRLVRATQRFYNEFGYDEKFTLNLDTTLTILPRDLSRTTSDIYLLTYPEIVDYLSALKRSGAAGIEEPQVQFYGKAAYPIGVLIITIIGVVIASVRRKGGKGVILAIGLTISLLYMAFMKIIEPFGATGVADPFLVALIPHAFFTLVSLIMLWRVPK